MDNKLIVTSEADAWELLKKLVNDEIDFSIHQSLQLDNWPTLDLHFEGSDFDSSVPTRIMPTLLDAQKEVNKLFCQLRYGNQSLRKLTQSDKERLELVVRVSPGSSKYETNLQETLNEAIKSAVGKMDSKHIMISVLGFGLLWTSGAAWKDWVNQQAKAAQLQTQVAMSNQETERLKIVTDALTKSHSLRDVSEGVNEFRNNSLNKLKEQDSFSIPNSPTTKVGGAIAQQITQKTKTQSTEERIDGDFLIISVSSGDTKGYKVKVKRITDNLIITVTIPDRQITFADQDILKDAEWSKKPVTLAINAKVLRGEVTTARIISISESEQSEKQ